MVAKVWVEDVFDITGRGKVLQVNILEGTVDKGNYFKLLIGDREIVYTIDSVEAIATSDQFNTGLLIKPLDNPDLSFLDNLKGQIVSIL